MDNVAYLLYHWDGWDIPSDTIICTDKTEALELLMALVEEEMLMTFLWMTLDEDVDTDWDWLAKEFSYYDGTDWAMMEVPIIYGDICC